MPSRDPGCVPPPFAQRRQSTARIPRAAAVLPLLRCMLGLYQCLKVVKTEELFLYRHAPADIRQKLGALAKEKQRELDLAFYRMLGGLMAAFVLVALRMKM